MNNFANNLKLFRKDKKMSALQLAERAQVSCSMIYKIENGKTQPTLQVAVRLSQALNVSLSSLLDETGDQHPIQVHPYAEQIEMKDNNGIIIRSLLPSKLSAEWFFVKMPQDTSTGMLPELEDKLRCLYILSGQLSIEISNGELVTLNVGDLFFTQEKFDHKATNIAPQTSEFFVLIMNP